jgi:hypothetical protein
MTVPEMIEFEYSLVPVIRGLLMSAGWRDRMHSCVADINVVKLVKLLQIRGYDLGKYPYATVAGAVYKLRHGQ